MSARRDHRLERTGPLSQHREGRPSRSRMEGWGRAGTCPSPHIGGPFCCSDSVLTAWCGTLALHFGGCLASGTHTPRPPEDLHRDLPLFTARKLLSPPLAWGCWCLGQPAPGSSSGGGGGMCWHLIGGLHGPSWRGWLIDSWFEVPAGGKGFSSSVCILMIISQHLHS